MYISIEGCIGTGKSTVAQQLAAGRKSQVVLERFEDNPFLDKFYSDPQRYALETELVFVLIHYHQMINEIHARSKSECISDFCITKDVLFAKMNLDGDDKLLFMHVYENLVKRLPSPDLMVCLRCSDDLLWNRIKQRQRSNESLINKEYIIRLNCMYEGYFAEITIPKIEINMDESDFLATPENIALLSDKIDNLIKM
jgi:deoxyguanosine kinase